MPPTDPPPLLSPPSRIVLRGHLRTQPLFYKSECLTAAFSAPRAHGRLDRRELNLLATDFHALNAGAPLISMQYSRNRTQPHLKKRGGGNPVAISARLADIDVLSQLGEEGGGAVS